MKKVILIIGLIGIMCLFLTSCGETCKDCGKTIFGTPHVFLGDFYCDDCWQGW